jgi:hypothetical protein
MRSLFENATRQTDRYPKGRQLTERVRHGHSRRVGSGNIKQIATYPEPTAYPTNGRTQLAFPTTNAICLLRLAQALVPPRYMRIGFSRSVAHETPQAGPLPSTITVQPDLRPRPSNNGVQLLILSHMSSSIDHTGSHRPRRPGSHPRLLTLCGTASVSRS